jgi:hypothetical protein
MAYHAGLVVDALGFGLIAYGSSLMSGKSSTDGKSDG